VRRRFIRRRVVRELVTLIGVVVILSGVVFAKTQFDRGSLIVQMEDWRTEQEEKASKKGVDLLDWDLLRATKGNRRKGPSFDKDLLTFDKEVVNIVGFMVPLYDFVNFREFILLPLPVECYFCEAPPMREVVIVRLAADETGGLVSDPVLINGLLNLHQGPDTKYFYTIEEGSWGAASEEQKLHRREVNLQQRLHAMRELKKEQGLEEELLEPVTMPSAEQAPEDEPDPTESSTQE